jgi:hypothetical protein
MKIENNIFIDILTKEIADAIDKEVIKIITLKVEEEKIPKITFEFIGHELNVLAYNFDKYKNIMYHCKECENNILLDELLNHVICKCKCPNFKFIDRIYPLICLNKKRIE